MDAHATVYLSDLLNVEMLSYKKSNAEAHLKTQLFVLFAATKLNGKPRQKQFTMQMNNSHEQGTRNSESDLFSHVLLLPMLYRKKVF